MDPNRRPDDMARITTPELAESFIAEQVAAVREQVGDKKVLLALSEDATSAETVIIMKAKDSATVSALSDCLQLVVDEKKSEMENYLPEQFDIVVKSSVQTKDNYVWLVISENADAILKIIEDGIS